MPRKLTGQEVLSMIELYSESDMTVADVCNQFGVCQRTLRDILHRRSWNSLTDNMSLPEIKKKIKHDYVFTFWSKVNRQEGCWIWNGSLTKKGYGQFHSKMIKESRAHRVAWLIVHGSIPDDLHVCHTCDVRACVNPDHLFLGTNQDNVNDKVIKNRQYRKAVS